MSTDGELRVDLRVPVRASRYELAVVLIRGTAPYHCAGDEREELSAPRAEKKLKALLCQYGTEIEGWSDGMEDERRDEWLAWAGRQVDRAYPTLAGRG